MSDLVNTKQKILVVGGGFGGIKAAEELGKSADFDVTLLSDQSYFQYYPALYSTATGHDHRESWVPLTEIFKKYPQVTVIKDRIETIDIKKKVVSGTTSYSYDKVILALGSVTTYFGIEGLNTYAYGIKSQAEIRKLQGHLFEEMADGSDDEKNYVIIGAGPTGVELAGALGEYIRVLRAYFGIKKKRVRIVLVEAAPRVLPRSAKASSRAAARRLRKLGVVIETNKKVEAQTAQDLIVNGQPLPTQTVIWTSGVTNAPFFVGNKDSIPLNERNKAVVDDYMRSSENVYVIGDNAATTYAGLAQTALHDAIFVSKHLKGSKDTYSAKQPPCVIPIGRDWALFEWGKVRFSGKIASYIRVAADIIGYHDILPVGYAVKAWRSQTKKELRIPDTLDSEIVS